MEPRQDWFSSRFTVLGGHVCINRVTGKKCPRNCPGIVLPWMKNLQVVESTHDKSRALVGHVRSLDPGHMEVLLDFSRCHDLRFEVRVDVEWIDPNNFMAIFLYPRENLP